jgi:polysaccharide pyruvyl transferase WcaK-like protein
VGVPLQMGYNKNDDTKVLRAFLQNIEQKIGAKTTMLSPKTPEETVRIISSVDLLIAERLHAAILATIVRKPFLSLMYDIKVQSYIQDIGYESFSVNMIDQLDGKEIHSKFFSLIAERKYAQTILEAAYKKNRTRAVKDIKRLKHRYGI